MKKAALTPGQYLRLCRLRAKQSARKLSVAIGADKSYISVVEKRNAVPPVGRLVALELLLPKFSGDKMHRLAMVAGRQAKAALNP